MFQISLCVVALLLSVIANFAEQFFTKAAGNISINLFSAITSPYFILGAISAIVLLLAYFFSLQQIPLRVAYASVTVGSLAPLSLNSALFEDQPLTLAHRVGIGCAIAAVFLLGLR